MSNSNYRKSKVNKKSLKKPEEKKLSIEGQRWDLHVTYFQKLHKQGKYAAAAAKSLQSCPTLRNPIDGSPAGSPVPGILQARTLV